VRYASRRVRHPIAGRLAEARVQQGLSRTELARQIYPVRQDTIGYVERGATSNPSLYTIVDIAAGLGKVVTLVDEEDFW
jgi:DNA-binding XRE family transcriptional regulator